MVAFGVVAMVGVAIGVFAAGLPAGAAGAAVVLLLLLVTALWTIGLSRVTDQRLVVPAMMGVGLAGAGLDLLQSRGPAFVAGYMGLTGLALRASRRVAIIAGLPVLAVLAVAEARRSAAPGSAALSVVLGAGFLFVASAFATANRDARVQAERLLAEEAALAAARAEAAAMAERARIARELHDVLAHTLSGLAVQLEATGLLARSTGADPQLVEQLARSRHLAREGMAGARRAVSALRGDALPGPALLVRLVADTRAAVDVPVELSVRGEPRSLAPEAGLTVYRVAQEALTNVAKHAGRGAEVVVEVTWGPQEVVLRVRDRGGDGVPAGLPSGGFGLSGMAERAALLGGELVAGPVEGGFEVLLRLPCPATTGDEG